MPDQSGRVLPPDGWVAMGTHAGPDYCAYTGPLEFSEPHPEDGMPRWERHDGCTAVAGRVLSCSVCGYQFVWHGSFEPLPTVQHAQIPGEHRLIAPARTPSAEEKK